jgi:iron complex outermembrane receptor protein
MGLGAIKPRRYDLLAGCAILALAPAIAFAAEEAPGSTVSPVVVVAPGAPDTGVDPAKLPGSTETLDAADLRRSGSLSITDALEQRVPGVSLSDSQGNSFARDLNYRGFTASPLQGSPEGLAVYMGGVRLNEAFGDTVNWDLIPETAIRRLDLVTGDPAFGLNALGGALSLTMKTGASDPGGEISVQGGSFGRAVGSAEFGASKGPWSSYLALEGGHDDGWRRQSPSDIARVYGDLGWSEGAGEVHLIANLATTTLGVVGATPVDMLAASRSSVFTFPQTTRDSGALVALNGSWKAGGGWTLQGSVYGRAFAQSHVDGNDGAFEGCTRTATSPLFGTLCLEDDDFPAAVRPTAADFQVQALNGTPIGCPPLVAGQTKLCNGIPYGSVDRTRTRTSTGGISLGVANDGKLFDRPNLFTAGLSLESSTIRFGSNSTLGLIMPDLSVQVTAGLFPGAGTIIKTAGAIAYTPVDLHADNRDIGVYALDTFDITDSLFLTLSGRWNGQHISTADRTGLSPDLTGSHDFNRFNPAAGLAWKIAPWITAYGGYAETNRAPTPLELSCANPLKPCLLENALVSDPPLKQVVAKSWQGGLRGASEVGGGRLDWSLGAYRTENDNDIIALASAIMGRGSYANVPQTRREGFEAQLNYRTERWSAYASASQVKATYQFTGTIASGSSPFADDNGNLAVTPGDQIGGVPEWRFKLGGDVDLTPSVTLGADVLGVGKQYLVGDEANQDSQLPSYWVAGVHGDWRLGHGLTLFGRVDNLFDKKYATFATYFETDALDNLHPSPLPDDPNPVSETPAPPRAFAVGLRWRW